MISVKFDKGRTKIKVQRFINFNYSVPKKLFENKLITLILMFIGFVAGCWGVVNED